MVGNSNGGAPASGAKSSSKNDSNNSKTIKAGTTTSHRMPDSKTGSTMSSGQPIKSSDKTAQSKTGAKTNRVQVTGNSHMGKAATKPATPSNNKTGSTMGSGRNNN